MLLCGAHLLCLERDGVGVDPADEGRVQADRLWGQLLQERHHLALAALLGRLERVGLEGVEVRLAGSGYDHRRVPFLGVPMGKRTRKAGIVKKRSTLFCLTDYLFCNIVSLVCITMGKRTREAGIVRKRSTLFCLTVYLFCDTVSLVCITMGKRTREAGIVKYCRI